MKLIFSLLLFGFAVAARSADSLEVRQAVTRRDLRCELSGAVPDRVILTVANSGDLSVTIAIPAGMICAGADGTAHLVCLRSAALSIAPGATAEALVPAALLSSKQPPPGKSLHLLDAVEPRLDPLLKKLADQQDVPRATAQLAVFCLLENMTFSGWQKFLSAQRGSEPEKEPHPTPAEVAQAIDALGLVREVAPERTFALASDGELKLRALRNPWCRAKAMQLYGIKVTDDASEYGLPNMSQLLHSKPGDNCPVCRARTEMQKGAGDF